MNTAAEFLTLAPGTLIAGRFGVERCLGFGSMSVVYLCRSLTTHERVAVKVLQPAAQGDESLATYHTRFRIGARIAQQVEHPRVARVLEFIEHPDLMACVIEYVDGPDLSTKMLREKVLLISEALRLLRQIADGVQCIHENGIVHRDLKPANILLAGGRDVKITDFGIARSEKSPRLTARGGVVGTMAYLSPEGLQGMPVDERGDIYAVGVIGYEMLTGELPFQGSSVYSVVEKKIKADPVPPQHLNSQCPEEFGRIILKAMHRDPEQRYRFAIEMQRDLDALAAQLELDPNFAPTRPHNLKQIGLVEERSPRRLSPSRLLWAVVLLLLFSAAAWLTLPPREDGANELGTPYTNMPSPANGAAIEAGDSILNEALTHPLESARPPGQRQTMLARFADFVEWPSQAFLDRSAPLRVCLVGNSGFGVEFDRLISHTKLSNGRGVWAQRFAGVPRASLLTACQILYVAGLPKEKAGAILEPLRHVPILTVTDGTGLGILDFISSPGDSSYTVDPGLAASADLRLSPILVDLAVRRPMRH